MYINNSGGKQFGKCPVERSNRKWQDNIMMDITKISCEDGDEWKWLRIMSCQISALFQRILYSSKRYHSNAVRHVEIVEGTQLNVLIYHSCVDIVITNAELLIQFFIPHVCPA
jgi:hypothetical protein